ncbi:RING finger protein 32-like [Prorops nasuta]|uniref:RING finger protein 32-like n=1 Tax=Prorops nasuta TaxID=863751 RepID=UPI0034CEEC71
MTHPGIALALLFGVGIGAVMYFVFAGRQEASGHMNQSREQRPEPRASSSTWDESPTPTRRRIPKRRTSGPQDCVICLEKIEYSAVRLDCDHYFHEPCIQDWFKKGCEGNKQECPLCRGKCKNVRLLA